MKGTMGDISNLLAKGRIHMTLIDPASQDDGKSAKIAREAELAGTDFIMIGGSTEIDSRKMDSSVKAIKGAVSRKVIIFPGSSAMISKYADAIYFMSLLNSRNPDFIIGHQARGSTVIRKMGIEAISMAYLVFEPGMTVGRQGDANLIGTDDWETALSYAMAAELLGLKLVYLEAGSGSPKTISPDIVSHLKANLNIPIIVGGGIRTAESAESILEAGADVIVTGTIAETASNVQGALKPIIDKVHSFGRANH